MQFGYLFAQCGAPPFFCGYGTFREGFPDFLASPQKLQRPAGPFTIRPIPNGMEHSGVRAGEALVHLSSGSNHQKHCDHLPILSCNIEYNSLTTFSSPGVIELILLS